MTNQLVANSSPTLPTQKLLFFLAKPGSITQLYTSWLHNLGWLSSLSKVHRPRTRIMLSRCTCFMSAIRLWKQDSCFIPVASLLPPCHLQWQRCIQRATHQILGFFDGDISPVWYVCAQKKLAHLCCSLACHQLPSMHHLPSSHFSIIHYLPCHIFICKSMETCRVI